ncbi:MAG: glycosyltransferase family 32 protein [Candidatus Babeliales bacterium]
MQKKILVIALCLSAALLSAIAIKQDFFKQTPINESPYWPSPGFPLHVDFLESMGPRKLVFNVQSPDDKEWYSFFHKLYDKNQLPNVRVSAKPLIPKIIHQIWLGGNPPAYLPAFQKTWQKFHPDWEYKLWRDDDVKHMKIHNQELFDAAVNYGQKADIFRYHILYEIGGLYADCDFRCLQKFDILHHCYDFYSGLNNCGNIEIANGLIGARPKHPILKQCIEKLAASTDTLKQLSKDDPEYLKKAFGLVISQTGPGFFTKSFMDVARTYDGPIIVLPCSFFYPLPNTHRNLTIQESEKYIKPESFAIHYWACSWMRPDAFIK